ncbi:MAG TPA: hypothetical protein VE397_03620 [Stellaceae bacterium]|jgi:hypothetical protein|nr:hypothetical protein [Stellaceae bacterium]
MRAMLWPFALVCLLLAGCDAWQTRAEFAPPQSRWNSSQPSPAGVNDKPPPIPAQYCYRTLANVDCYSEAVPSRITGFTGLYPDPYSLPQYH